MCRHPLMMIPMDSINEGKAVYKAETVETIERQLIDRDLRERDYKDDVINVITENI